MLKLALIDSPPVILSVHVGAVPPHASPQPSKVAAVSGLAVRVTVESCRMYAEQSLGHSIDPLVGSVAAGSRARGR